MTDEEGLEITEKSPECDTAEEEPPTEEALPFTEEGLERTEKSSECETIENEPSTEETSPLTANQLASDFGGTETRLNSLSSSSAFKGSWKDDIDVGKSGVWGEGLKTCPADVCCRVLCDFTHCFLGGRSAMSVTRAAR